jgi:hypothetical protein
MTTPRSYAEALDEAPEARGLVPEPDYPWPADDEPDDPYVDDSGVM